MLLHWQTRPTANRKTNTYMHIHTYIYIYTYNYIYIYTYTPIDLPTEYRKVAIQYTLEQILSTRTELELFSGPRWLLSVRYRIVLYAVPYSTQCRIVGRYVRILSNIDKILTKNIKDYKHMPFFKRACRQQKKSACGSGQRSKHGLGLPILTKYWQILIIIVLLSIIIIG